MKDIEFKKAWSFTCSCGDLVAMRFTKLVGENIYWCEFWHKMQSRVDGFSSYNTKWVGKNLRVILQDAGCDSWEWFSEMGFEDGV